MKVKEDILSCTFAELSFGLCQFIQEVRRPNGEKYDPDSILYLCLGIQQVTQRTGILLRTSKLLVFFFFYALYPQSQVAACFFCRGKCVSVLCFILSLSESLIWLISLDLVLIRVNRPLVYLGGIWFGGQGVSI